MPTFLHSEALCSPSSSVTHFSWLLHHTLGAASLGCCPACPKILHGHDTGYCSVYMSSTVFQSSLLKFEPMTPFVVECNFLRIKWYFQFSLKIWLSCQELIFSMCINLLSFIQFLKCSIWPFKVDGPLEEKPALGVGISKQ